MDLEGEFGTLIDQKMLFKAVIDIYSQASLWFPSDDTSTVKEFGESLLSPEFILI